MFKHVIRLENIRDNSITFNSQVELSIPRKNLNEMLTNFDGRIEGNNIIFKTEKDMLLFSSNFFGFLARNS